MEAKMKKVLSIFLSLILAMVLSVSFAAPAMAASVTPTKISDNPTPSDAGYSSGTYFSLKVDPPKSGNYNDGTYSVQWTISADNKYLSFSNASPGIAAVLVKGGNSAYLYAYNPAVNADTGLRAPDNQGGNIPDISHLFFIWKIRTASTISTQIYLKGSTSPLPASPVPAITLGSQVFDKAILVPSSATGNVTFTLYKGTYPDASNVKYVETVALSNGTAQTAAVNPLHAGSYYWRAVYSGDNSNLGSTSSCEPFTVSKGNVTLETAILDANAKTVTDVPLASVVHDQATVTGNGVSGFAPSGTVAFTFNSAFAGSSNINGSDPAIVYSTNKGPLDAGSYKFNATYTDSSGDYNNAISADEPLKVVQPGKIILVKNTTIADDTFSFSGTGGNEFPAAFSITTSGYTGSKTFEVGAGTYGISENLSSDWKLHSSSILPIAAGTPGSFTVAEGQTVTVTFNNYKESIPPPPLPEAPAVVLLSLGLAGLGAFMIIRRKQIFVK